ncbi:transporter substrate-binding domain-containing protein [Halomicronema hongdechloris]|uniref:transporter substrate-binding domain-containing protein n=1 Tax=Halomicronema hongdechloris TaxID=1209493 RepID=UPI00211B464F|nr:transporter substrate-binding domain-containing protein [Halomicronema hongdechloris]
MSLAALPISVAAELEEIRARGHLVVAVKDNWRPLGFRNDAGELVGFEIDIARQLAQVLVGDAAAITLAPVANQERLPVVMEGRVDLAIAGVAATPARMRLVSFSMPYYLDGTAVVAQDPQIRALQDVGPGPLTVLAGSDAIATLQYLLPHTVLNSVTSYQAALSRLQAGQTRGVAADLTVLTGWVQEHPDYHLLPNTLSSVPLAVVMPKGVQYNDLRRQVNNSIHQWHQDGWLEERATAWGLP